MEFVSKWIKEQQHKLKEAPKYEPPCLSIKEINDMFEYLKEKIKECQAEQLRKEQE